MKLRTNELIAVILLGLATLLSFTWMSDLFRGFFNFIDNLFNGDASFSYFLYFAGCAIGILITPIVIIDIVFIFVGKKKFAMYGAVVALALWLLSAFVLFLGALIEGYYGFSQSIGYFFLHTNGAFTFLTGIPLLLILFCAAALLALAEYPNKFPALAPLAAALDKPIGDINVPQQSQQYFTPPQQTYVPPQNVPSLKKCPECAEFVQPDAIKCRFCNYRFG